MTLHLTSCADDQINSPKPCPCGDWGRFPQTKIVRIPGTFNASARVIFCMGGCHREGVGMDKRSAVDAWNATFKTGSAQ